MDKHTPRCEGSGLEEMKGPEEDMEELTAKEVAVIFGVTVGTVSAWRKRKILRSQPMPRNWRRAGYRYRIADIVDLTKALADQGYSERQFRAWYASRPSR